MTYGDNSLKLNNGELLSHTYKIMPFTSYYDKEDKEIYHSDIILLDNDIKQVYDIKRYHILVGFSNGGFMVGNDIDPYYLNLYLWIIAHDKTRIKVVGNFYENLELLDEKT